MKKLNKKGFTLVELLAVVVILLAISVIAVSSISAAIGYSEASGIPYEMGKDAFVSKEAYAVFSGVLQSADVTLIKT